MTTENVGYITIAEAAEALNRTTSTVRNLAHAGIFGQKQEWDGTRNRTVLLRADVEGYRDSRDAVRSGPKTKEVNFPIKRESIAYDDWILGQVLSGLCANPNFETRDSNYEDMKELVSKAYLIASLCDGFGDLPSFLSVETAKPATE